MLFQKSGLLIQISNQNTNEPYIISCLSKMFYHISQSIEIGESLFVDFPLDEFLKFIDVHSYSIINSNILFFTLLKIIGKIISITYNVCKIDIFTKVNEYIKIFNEYFNDDILIRISILKLMESLIDAASDYMDCLVDNVFLLTGDISSADGNVIIIFVAILKRLSMCLNNDELCVLLGKISHEGLFILFLHPFAHEYAKELFSFLERALKNEKTEKIVRVSITFNLIKYYLHPQRMECFQEMKFALKFLLKESDINDNIGNIFAVVEFMEEEFEKCPSFIKTSYLKVYTYCMYSLYYSDNDLLLVMVNRLLFTLLIENFDPNLIDIEDQKDLVQIIEFIIISSEKLSPQIVDKVDAIIKQIQ